MAPLVRRFPAVLAVLLLIQVPSEATESDASHPPAQTVQAAPPGAYGSSTGRYAASPGRYGAADLPPPAAGYGDYDRYGRWDRGTSRSAAYDEPWGYRAPYAEPGSSYGAMGGQVGADYWGPEASRLPRERPRAVTDPTVSGYEWAERYPAASVPPVPARGYGPQGTPSVFGPADDYGWASPGGFATGFAGARDWTEEQGREVRRILRQARRAQHEFQGQMIAAQDALEEVLEVGRPEPEAVGEAYAKIFDIQRRMIVERVRTANEIAAVLNSAEPPPSADVPEPAADAPADAPAEAATP